MVVYIGLVMVINWIEPEARPVGGNNAYYHFIM